MSSTHDNTRAVIAAGLQKRHARTTRFKRMGIAALVFAVAMLVWLMTSLLEKGISGMMRHEITLVAHTNQVKAATLSDRINYTLVVQQAFDRTFPAAKDAMVARERFTLLGDFAAFAVKDAYGTRTEKKGEFVVQVPLADAADQYFKSQGARAGALSAKQKAFLDELQHKGAVERVLNRDFFTRGDSRAPESAGFLGSMVGSLLLVLVAITLALPVGVMGAIYLEEFARKSIVSDIIEVSINNLAAVPSIIFGLLGLTLYLIWFDMPRSSALVGGLTIALMVLPTIIITTRAALKAVPPSVRMAAVALGAAPTQVVRHHVLPYAMPGIMTGTILSIARGLGETAPLLMIGMVAFVADVPRGLFDPATAMPVSVYIWSSSPELGFVEKTASGILVLLAILMVLNAIAIYIRNRFELRW